MKPRRDIIHAGVIDKPMYEHPLDASVAIADLSTSNENAIYELGICHALRPRTTTVIANRVRRQILDIVDNTLKSLPRDERGQPFDPHEAYWLGATRLEALFGLGEFKELEAAKTSCIRMRRKSG